MYTGVLLVAIASLIPAACGGSGTQQNLPSTMPDPAAPIGGREHIAWTQLANSVANYVFLIYVDNARDQLPQTMCAANAAGSFNCDSPLPPLTNGKHTLELAAAIVSGDSFIEGAKSAAIVVTVDGSAAISGSIRVWNNGGNRPTQSTANAQASAPGNAATGSPTSSCGLTVWDPATVLAWTTNGEIDLASVATQNIRPLIWQNDLQTAEWNLQSLVRRVNAGGSWVYAVATAVGEPVVRVVRYRELNGVLGERAVLMQRSIPTAPAHAAAAFGSDGILYVSFRWTSAQSEAQPFVLDVDVDGLRPDVGAGLDPRFVSRDAIATTWDVDGRFWILESPTSGRYSVRASDSARPLWTFASDAPPIGIEALTDSAPPSLAVFAASGDGWVLARDRGITPTKFDRTLDAGRQATVLTGGEAISCRSSPALTLSYAMWRGEPPRSLGKRRVLAEYR